MTTTIHFSGLSTKPASLIHPASDSPHGVGPRTSLLIWWLTFNQVGLRSPGDPHPLGNIVEFHPTMRESQRFEFISARSAIGYPPSDLFIAHSVRSNAFNSLKDSRPSIKQKKRGLDGCVANSLSVSTTEEVMS